MTPRLYIGLWILLGTSCMVPLLVLLFRILRALQLIAAILSRQNG